MGVTLLIHPLYMSMLTNYSHIENRLESVRNRASCFGSSGVLSNERLAGLKPRLTFYT